MIRNSLILSSLLVLSLDAYQFKSIGFKSIAMGGAGIANSDITAASYYNPALLGFNKNNSIASSLNFSIGLSENNIAENMDYLNKNMDSIDNLNRYANIGRVSEEDLESIRGVQKAFKSMVNQDNYLDIDSNLSFSINFGSIGVSIYNSLDIFASANLESSSSIVDYSKVIFENGTSYYEVDTDTGNYTPSNAQAYSKSFVSSIDDTSVDIEALLLTEVPLSYGFKLNDFGFGVNLKYMRAEYYLNTIDIDSESSYIEDSYDANDKSIATTYSADIGFIYAPSQIQDLKIGFVVKNINTPTFEFESGEEVEFSPMSRVGMSYKPTNSIEFAFDADLSENGFKDDIKSQYIGGGVSFLPFESLALRVGAMKDIAIDESNLIYSAGFSLGIPLLYIDVAAQISSETTEFEGEEVPAYNRVNLALVSKWY